MSNNSSNFPPHDMLDRKCVSVIIIWSKTDFYKVLGGIRGIGGGKVAMERLLATISRCQQTCGCDAKFESQSSVEGNQARKDLVFQTETEARKFNLEVTETVKVSSEVLIKTFMYTEAQLGLQLEPVLMEKDVLNLYLFGAGFMNFFRHFISCKVAMEDQQILFKFESVSDLNLFLYNKSHHTGRKALGSLKDTTNQYKLSPDSEGKFVLVMSEKLLQNSPLKCRDTDDVDWIRIEEKYRFKSEMVECSRNRELKFENKLDLYTFMASTDVKACEMLALRNDDVIEDLDDLQLYLETMLAEEQRLQSDVVALDKELLDAKLTLAKKEAVVESQNTIIKELKSELRAKKVKTKN